MKIEPKHFRNLEGAARIDTPELDKLHEDLATATDPAHLSIAAAIGQFGCGKTYAVATALRGVTIRWEYVSVLQATNHRGLVALIGAELDSGPWDGTYREMRKDLIRLLAEPTLIVLDEAHKLQPAAVTELRSLYDDERTQLAIILVGGPALEEKLALHEELDDRVACRTWFTPLNDREAAAAMRIFHPIYEEASADLLGTVNQQLLGRYRRWSSFTLDLLKREQPLTLEVATDILASQRGERVQVLREDEEQA
jgi:DNA transposition AAA+ family ATPase